MAAPSKTELEYYMQNQHQRQSIIGIAKCIACHRIIIRSRVYYHHKRKCGKLQQLITTYKRGTTT